jgi:hypothetical protein
MKRPALVPFFKAPREGAVKTRLCPPLHAAQACALHRAFAQDLLARCATLAADVVLSTDDPTDAFVAELARRHGVPIRPQPPGDLGERMADVVAALAPDHEGVVLVGADCPTLPAGHLDEALERAGDGPVIGPAADGGYLLIGLPRPAPELFSGLRWGGPDVLAETLRRAENAGLALRLLPPWYDVDTGEDLGRLRVDLARLPADAAPATRAALAAIRGRARPRRDRRGRN